MRAVYGNWHCRCCWCENVWYSQNLFGIKSYSELNLNPKCSRFCSYPWHLVHRSLMAFVCQEIKGLLTYLLICMALFWLQYLFKHIITSSTLMQFRNSVQTISDICQPPPPVIFFTILTLLPLNAVVAQCSKTIRYVEFPYKRFYVFNILEQMYTVISDN